MEWCWLRLVFIRVVCCVGGQIFFCERDLILVYLVWYVVFGYQCVVYVDVCVYVFGYGQGDVVDCCCIVCGIYVWY